MKRFCNICIIILAISLPWVASAQTDNKHATGTVVNEWADSPISWEITAWECDEEGVYDIMFNATIEDGYHGYAMNDFSAPYFDFDAEISLIGPMVEPLTPTEDITEYGDISLIYYHNAIYVQRIQAKPGQTVTGFIQATICTNNTQQCTSNPATFTIEMPESKVTLTTIIGSIISEFDAWIR